MTDATPLLAEIRAISLALEADRQVAPERMSRAVVAARDVSGSLDAPGARELSEALGRMELAVVARRQRIAARLGALAEGRRALRGYGGLRACREGQRVRRKA